MSLFDLLLILAIGGLGVWLLLKYVPMGADFQRLIRIVAIVAAVICVLQAFGVLDWIRALQVPRVGG